MEKPLIASRHTTFSATLKDSLAVSYKSKHNFPILLSNYILYSNSVKTYFHKKSTQILFIVELFMVAKSWRQPKCPSVYEWISPENDMLFNSIKGSQMTEQ